MRSRQRVIWAKFRVACVSVVALLILGVLLYLVTGGMLFKEQTKLYLYIPDATGVGAGSPVRVDGITVGKVDAVSLSGSSDPKRVVRLTLQVERDSLPMIPTASYADLGTDDPVGDKFVDITSAGRGAMTPNSEILFKPGTDMFKTLDPAQFEASLRQMDAILTDIETGRGRVGQFVQNTQMYNDLRRRIGDIEAAIRNAADRTSALGQELYTDRLYRRMRAPVQELDQALARLQSGQGAGGRLLRDSAQYDQAAATVVSLRNSIAEILASSMIRSDAMYSDWVRLVVSMTRQVDDMNVGPLFAAPQSYESWTGAAREFAETLREFRQDPRKFMRLRMF